MAEVEPQHIGSYHILSLLRSSSTGEIYQGQQHKKAVLLQRLPFPLETTEVRESFLVRARQLKKLKSSNIVNVLDANIEGDYGYLVMGYFQGEMLLDSIKPGVCLPPVEVKRYLSPVASALHYAHARNVFHGQLYPGVIWSETNTPNKNILLCDFSLCLPAPYAQILENPLARLYMAPEQLQGQVISSSASDQYALAVIAYELLCGRRPYSATKREELLQQIQQEPLPTPRSLNPAISEAVEQVILRALSIEPDQRFSHTQEFADHYLGALLGIPVKSKTAPRIAALPATPALPSPLAKPSSTKKEKKISTPVSQDGDILQDNHSSTQLAQPVIDLAELRPDPSNMPPLSLQPEPSQPEPEQLSSNRNSLKAFLEAEHTRQTIRSEQVEISTHQEHVSPPDSQTPIEKIVEPIEKLRLGTLPLTPIFDDDYDDGLPLDFSLPLQKLASTVANDLQQGGVLSNSLPGYEERPAQIEMATVVSQAIAQKTPAIIEAATGTGKSLAYLVPVVRSGQVAIISTANKALQEQLFYKDIPFVQKYIKPFGAALVKGVNNYICLDRVESERTGIQYFAKNTEFMRLYDMIMDPPPDFNGDFETLGFTLPADIRGRIATDNDQCSWSKCSYFEECYVHQMRDRAERAQVIVVNHTLLLLDAVMDGYLLPERDLIVLDEAHHLEEEATRSFTITVTGNQIQTLLAQKMLKNYSQLSLQDDVIRAAQQTWMVLEDLADPGNKGRTNLTEPLEEGLKLASFMTDLADSLRKQRPKNLEEKDALIFDKLLKRTQNLAVDLRTVFSAADPKKFVYYIERGEGSTSRNLALHACAAPLDVTEWLKERLFKKCNVICTSATLATVGPHPTRPDEKGPNFAYFRRRTGLDYEERPDVIERILPLTFDYEENALIYLPRDLPAPAYGPGSDEYMKAIAREMYKLVKISEGRAFLLFSSKRMLDRAFELMEPHLPYPLLKQGDMTRLQLTKRFRQEQGSILFGLKSFWEGVDISGDALSLVVIDKLPFDPPDDPVNEARVAQMKAAGENWFGTYVLPQAVLRLKQGIGRLLRSRDDRGVMAILDTRLHTKGYGKMVLNALPPARRTSSLRDVERFFSQ